MRLAWRTVLGALPVPIVYTDRLPGGVGGLEVGPLVLIRPKYRDRGDEGLHQHELEHVRQWWCSLGLHSLLYLGVRRYRLWAEARAYAVQMRYPNGLGGALSLDDAAWRLAGERYGLGIDVERARAEIRDA